MVGERVPFVQSHQMTNVVTAEAERATREKITMQLGLADVDVRSQSMRPP